MQVSIVLPTPIFISIAHLFALFFQMFYFPTYPIIPSQNLKCSAIDQKWYFLVIYITLRKLASSWLATALASRVFPVPGGPYSRQPCHHQQYCHADLVRSLSLMAIWFYLSVWTPYPLPEYTNCYSSSTFFSLFLAPLVPIYTVLRPFHFIFSFINLFFSFI